MKITLLGTGTSSGVPVLGCDCEVCRSKDPRDNRLRCAAMIETERTRILIDAGPDIRQHTRNHQEYARKGLLYSLAQAGGLALSVPYAAWHLRYTGGTHPAGRQDARPEGIPQPGSASATAEDLR